MNNNSNGTGFFSHLKGTKSKVESILEKYPRTKDSDNVLVIKFWSIEKLSGIEVKDFTNVRSITRARQMLQSEFPELRGLSYKRRNTIEAPEVRANISTI